MHKYFFPAIFVISLCFLFFITGATLSAFKAFPHGVIHKAYLGGKAVYELSLRKKDKRITMAWNRQRRPERGLLRHNAASAYSGFTLFTSTAGQKAHLLSMEGKIVHEWHIPYAKIWERTNEIPVFPNNDYVYWRKAEVMPDGDLFVIVVEAGMTPWGLALIKMDRHSNLIWKYSRRVHHDFAIDSGGRVFTLTHRIRKKPLGDLKNIAAPFLEDFLAILSPDGTEIEQISLYDALKKSHWMVLHYAPPNDKGDYLHANAVELFPPHNAAVFPFVQPGQVMISMRDINFIGTLDISTKSFAWATTGPWFHQHDPQFLDNGNIILFDNLGNLNGKGGKSRIIEFNPASHEIVWSYEGTVADKFYSEVRGSQNVLPNGNVLITESEGGRIFEVTRNKEIVWEYITPATHESDSALIAAICNASRKEPSYFDPDFLAEITR